MVGDDEPMMEANGDLSGLSLASVIFPVIGREPLARYTKEACVVDTGQWISFKILIASAASVSLIH